MLNRGPAVQLNRKLLPNALTFRISKHDGRKLGFIELSRCEFDMHPEYYYRTNYVFAAREYITEANSNFATNRFIKLRN